MHLIQIFIPSELALLKILVILSDMKPLKFSVKQLINENLYTNKIIPESDFSNIYTSDKYDREYGNSILITRRKCKYY